jgi:hypothetical protein
MEAIGLPDIPATQPPLKSFWYSLIGDTLGPKFGKDASENRKNCLCWEANDVILSHSKYPKEIA